MGSVNSKSWSPIQTLLCVATFVTMLIDNCYLVKSSEIAHVHNSIYTVTLLFGACRVQLCNLIFEETNILLGA